MRLEANKDVVRKFFRLLENGEPSLAVDMVADDARWWVQGAGDLDKAALFGLWSGVFGPPSPSKFMRVISLTAEDDRVSAEVESDIRLPDGRDYRNTFHTLFIIREGRIVGAREYFDTAYAQKLFGSTG